MEETYRVEIIPYHYGKYFGSELLFWLWDTFDHDDYFIVPMTSSQVLSSVPQPIAVVFNDESLAMAFKLRWA